MNRPLALVTMVAFFGATLGVYRFPAHKIGYHIGATTIILAMRESAGLTHCGSAQTRVALTKPSIKRDPAVLRVGCRSRTTA